MRNKSTFSFKQFDVVQERSAMKIGIDGVLLGAWINIEGSKQVLDVGCGTGLISLMVAQRSDAFIHAIDIDEDAAMESQLNFKKSNWADRLKVYHSSLQNFVSDQLFDHIVSNPPFFENSFKSDNAKRMRARHADSLSLTDLLGNAKAQLSLNGKISLILPADREEALMEAVSTHALFVCRKTMVHPFQSREPNRLLIELRTEASDCAQDSIAIRDEHTKQYSDEYKALTTDFYLAH